MRPPSERSCSAVALIRAAYANVHPLERFSTTMRLFRLPIIVYAIMFAHVSATVLMNDIWMKSRMTFSRVNKL